MLSLADHIGSEKACFCYNENDNSSILLSLLTFDQCILLRNVLKKVMLHADITIILRCCRSAFQEINMSRDGIAFENYFLRVITICRDGEGCVLVLKHFIDDNDIEDAKGPYFSEEIIAMKREMSSILNASNSCQILRSVLYAPEYSMYAKSPIYLESECMKECESQRIIVNIAFENYDQAVECMYAMDNSLIGGNMIPTSVWNSTLSADEIQNLIEESIAHISSQSKPTSLNNHTSNNEMTSGPIQSDLQIIPSQPIEGKEELKSDSKLPKHSNPSLPLLVLLYLYVI
jgi:hypothetical protein